MSRARGWRAIGAALALAAVCSAAASETDPGASAAAVLARAARASGGAAWASVRDIETSGTLSGGVEGDTQTREDVRAGRFASHDHVGGRTSGEGFDGRRFWTSDASGRARVEGGASLARAVSIAYRTRRAYFRPPSPGETRVLAPAATEDRWTYDVVRVTPRGGTAFDLWFDRRTGLLDRTVEPLGPAVSIERFADYRRVRGVMLPFTSVTTVGDARFDQTFHAERVAVNGGLPAKGFSPPPPPPPDYAFPASADHVELPFSLFNNHIYVRARIGTGPPRMMMFDTGATNLLDPRAAAEAGLTPKGQVSVNGLPGGELAVPTLELGGVRFSNLPFTVVDSAEQARVEGVADRAGVLGYEIPRRVVMRIDYGRGVITLTKPQAARPPRGAKALPFDFVSQLLVVTASVDGHPGRFALDTGSRASILLLPKYAHAAGLDRTIRTHEALVGWGLDGPIHAPVGRAQSLDFGGFVIARPLTVLLPGGPPVDGNIGGAILKRFTLTLDYGRRRIWLSPNDSLGTPDPEDLSGLWMNQDPDGFRIVSVAEATPGAAVGLRAGDLVAAIDGVAATELSLSAVRARLKAPGAAVRLSVRGADGAREIALRLPASS